MKRNKLVRILSSDRLDLGGCLAGNLPIEGGDYKDAAEDCYAAMEATRKLIGMESAVFEGVDGYECPNDFSRNGESSLDKTRKGLRVWLGSQKENTLRSLLARCQKHQHLVDAEWSRILG